MKFIIYLALALMLVSSVFAVSTSNSKEIYKQADKLKQKTEIKTAEKIDAWVESAIKYNFSWYSQGIDKTWKIKKGDCTDRAELKCYMLTHLGIKCRTVHGWAVAVKGDKKIKHDWIEYYVNKKWQTNEATFWYSLNKTGGGIW